MAKSTWANAKGLFPDTAAPSGEPLVARVGAAVLGGRLGRQRVLRRLRRPGRLLEAAELADQVVPLAGLQDRRGLAAELRVLAEERMEADGDVVVVVRQRHGVPAEAEQRDDLVRAHRALEQHQPSHSLLRY